MYVQILVLLVAADGSAATAFDIRQRAADDQVRVTTPAKAREIGSDYIVVGRPITASADPAAAYLRCCEEFIG